MRWFSRCQQGLTAEEEQAFQAWLAADPRHADLFNELDGTWSLLDRMAQATAAPLPQRSARRGWRRGLTWGAVAATAAAVAVGYLQWWQPRHYTAELSTAVGSIRTVRLADGSTARLNTHSSLRAAFRPEERRVVLTQGEVHFHVAKSAARPFVVEVDGLAIRAVGTAFNIHLSAKSVEVLVTEGMVQVCDTAVGPSAIPAPNDSATTRPQSAAAQLAAGEKLVLPRSTPAPFRPVVLSETRSTPVTPDEMQRTLAWQQDRLIFVLAPLADIVADFNRYNHRPLVIGDADLARQRFGGSFKPTDPAGLVRMLQQNFGVTVEEHSHATVLRARK